MYKPNMLTPKKQVKNATNAIKCAIIHTYFDGILSEVNSINTFSNVVAFLFGNISRLADFL